ncbi:MAG: hypothetical protein M1815_000742 [Lichina confinis]|nr:MAG: hypothetical protein M1815_000742 [Lichina confinis]
MAASDVDQKFLGRFAKRSDDENPYLASMLYKMLGLSVVLAKKLVRARRLRKLDTTRDTKSLQLYHHIIWLSREGLVIVEQYILPMVENYDDELKVLSYKLRASFHHIFVLFHNYPPVTQSAIPAMGGGNGGGSGGGSGGGGGGGKRPRSSPQRVDGTNSPSPLMNGGPVGGGGGLPPGLGGTSFPKPTSSFLLPAMNFIPKAQASFEEVGAMADQLLPGSHPIRLSVKLEYAAFAYDCLKDADASRRIAKHAITDVYNAQEEMDDDSFEDAAELVRTLARMVKRGPSSTPGSTPGGGSSSTPGSRTTPNLPPLGGAVGAAPVVTPVIHQSAHSPMMPFI